MRGTLFWGLSDDQLNSTYACFKDTIEIRAAGKTVLLKPGEKTMIPYGKAPGKTEPSKLTLDYMNNFEVDGSIQEFKEMLNPK